MSGTHDDSTLSSLPDLPTENSHGSSVSTDFVNEYDELLKYAIVAPRVHIEQNAYIKDLPIPEKELSSSIKESSDERIEVSTDVILKMVAEDYKVESRILEAKRAVEKTPQFHAETKTQFKLPNALESLFVDYSGTPTTEKEGYIDHENASEGSPESGVCSPATVDRDLIRMDSLMDDWCLQLKRNVLAELADMKTRQLQNEEMAAAELKSNYNLEVVRLTHEVDSMKELLYTFEQNVKQKDELIKNLTDALNKQKDKSDKIRMFSMWRLKLNDEHRLEFASKMADKFYKKALCTKVWDGWRTIVENKWKQRVEKACQIKSQEVCLKLTEDYEERLQALQRELQNSRGNVAQLHTERDSYEENMKKAFMRGVCALNMEAMSMFNEGKSDDNCVTQPIPHHPCLVPTSSSTSTAAFPYEPYETVAQNASNMQMPGESGYQQETAPSKKHVTFNNQPQYEISNTSNKNINNRVNNKKTLNVKMVAKGSGKKEKSIGSSRPSSVSSIKIERHMPLDTGQHRPSSAQGGLKSNFKGDASQSDVHSGRRNIPMTVKVVD